MKPTFMGLLKADATREQLEEWCRSQAQSYSQGDKTAAVVCRVLGKYIMYTAARDTALTPHLALNGIWEPWVTMAIARHVKTGMVCMDVGSCYGYYALLMRDIVGEQGYVEAWEPVWAHVVQMNASVNGLGLTILKAAMAPEEGKRSIAYPDQRNGFNAGDVPLLVYKGNSGVFVQARPPAPREYDFIKIDVEGAEADVWQALAGVREVSPSLTVCMEFTPNKHERPDTFLSLVAADFNIGTVGHDGVPRACSLEEAIVPDTGDFRMLWLTRKA